MARMNTNIFSILLFKFYKNSPSLRLKMFIGGFLQKDSVTDQVRTKKKKKYKALVDKRILLEPREAQD